HKHADGTCPITGASGSNPHAFCPPQDGDVRAPCPALNTMANHGYLPRDGKALTAPMIRQALVECYGLSKTLAFLLTNGALLLLNQGRGNFQLSDFARHNKIEHNASLYHLDAGPRDEYSPIHGDPGLLDLLFKDSASGVVMTPEDIARVRVRRQLTSSIPTFYAEVARGEIAIVLNMFNNPDADLHERQHRDPATTPLDGVPIDRLRYWFEHERLPEGWRPYHATTVRQTMTTISRIRAKM
ncbi:Cloroperoxidase, partial [Trametopsis cervina]